MVFLYAITLLLFWSPDPAHADPAYDGPEMRAVRHVGYENVAIDRQGVVEAWTSPKVKEIVARRGTFRFDDDLEDVWGEVSAGVNLFNFSETTSVFAKVDYTFGEDVQGVGGKGGMRVSW